MRKELIMTRTLCVFIIILVILLSSMTLASANDGVLGMTPDGVYPITQTDIMMKSEEIYIKVTGASAKVTCKFVFKNLSHAQTVLMGFPARLDIDLYEGEFTTEEDISVRNFTARDEDGKIPVALLDTLPDPPQKEAGGMEKYSKWYSFSVDFKEHEEKTLYHTYDVNFSYFSDGSIYLGYVIETGSLWKGSIGHSKVIFDFGGIPMYAITTIYPNNYYKIDGNRLIFERSDFKPDYNLQVSMNLSAYDDLQWFDWHYSPFGGKEAAKKKIELFQTSPEVIRKNTEHYFQLYESLIHQDPVSALYIKSALGLPDGDEKPEITECSIRNQMGNTLYFDIFGKDPDGDIVNCRGEVNGNVNLSYHEDGVYFDYEKMQFHGRGYIDLQDQESSVESITFTMTDASGNTDSKTLLLAEIPKPESTQASQTPQPPNPGENGLPVYEEVGSSGSRIVPMEEETIPLLTAGVFIILLLSLAAVALFFVRTKNKGYLLFAAQLIFVFLSFYQIREMLSMRGNTAGAMLSEDISLKIGISAVLWAISMTFMVAGISAISKKENHEALSADEEEEAGMESGDHKGQ